MFELTEEALQKLGTLFVKMMKQKIKERVYPFAPGYKGDGNSGWINTKTGTKGSYPLPLPKPGGAKGLLELGHEKGVKIMASIGGWSMWKHFSEIANDPKKKARFIKDCVTLMNMGFDGIDIDWEFPGPFDGMNFTGTAADYTNFKNLVKEF